ncbi:MAG TPA: ATP-binding cassette domain-containing protein [bacterium]|nr:ATP-binding cassette domain-containing protein [bacterium]
MNDDAVRSDVVLSVQDMSYRYGERDALQDITFAVQAGEYIGIIGPNGGGKSTLVQLLLGLLQPQKGSVRWYGLPPKAFIQEAAIGYVPQRILQGQAYFPASVREVVQSGFTGSTARQLTESIRKERIQHVLEHARITDITDRIITSLSGGQLQRVFIARALVCQPKVLILDEPFAGVDVQTQHDFYAYLRDLHQSHHLTILLVSHDVDMISQEVDRVLCLQGQMVCNVPRQQFSKQTYLEMIHQHAVHAVTHEHILHTHP